MRKNFNSKALYRVIDANINRANEGLRVVEEFTRFILNDYSLTSKLKIARHTLRRIVDCLPLDKSKLYEERNSQRDIGKNILARETQRGNLLDVLLANLGRTKESIRVLEEFSKLIAKNKALSFKEIRYAVYDIEKRIVKKIKAIRNIG